MKKLIISKLILRLLGAFVAESWFDLFYRFISTYFTKNFTRILGIRFLASNVITQDSCDLRALIRFTSVSPMEI